MTSKLKLTNTYKIFLLLISTHAWGAEIFSKQAIVDEMIKAPEVLVGHARQLQSLEGFRVPDEVGQIPPAQILPYLNDRFNATISTEERVKILRTLQVWRELFAEHAQQQLKVDFPPRPGEDEFEYFDRMQLVWRTRLLDLYQQVPPRRGLIELYRKGLTNPVRAVREAPDMNITSRLIDSHVLGKDFEDLLNELIHHSQPAVRAKGISMASFYPEEKILPLVRRCLEDSPDDAALCLKAIEWHSGPEADKTKAKALALGNPEVIQTVLEGLKISSQEEILKLLRPVLQNPKVAAHLNILTDLYASRMPPEIVEAAWKHGNSETRIRILSHASRLPASTVGPMIHEASHSTDPRLKDVIDHNPELLALAKTPASAANADPQACQQHPLLELLNHLSPPTN